MRSFSIMGKRAAKGLAVAFVLLGAVSAVSYASEADTSQTKAFTLDYNTRTIGVFPKGVSYEGISLEGKTLDEAKSEISDYIEDRQSRYMAWTILGSTYEYNASSFGVACTNADIVNELDDLGHRRGNPRPFNDRVIH